MNQRSPVRPAFAVRSTIGRLVLGLGAVLAAASFATASDPPPASNSSTPPVDFLRDVRPILINRCYRCHSSLQQDSDLRLDLPEAIVKGGASGPAIVAGRSAESLLIKAIERTGDLKMPPEGAPLQAAEIDLLRRWIDQGAKLPQGDEAKHWSFVPPRRRPTPQPTRRDWPLGPADAWIAAAQEAAGIAPSPAAPPHLLLRRLSLDLIGLPPSVEELREFLKDESPDALERAADRLLAHPAHGERWGRHWMDVWRYSDWDGYGAEVRESQPHIWRWRDWIVESINGDRPYDRMVQEMLAGDELAPDDPQTLRATGFLVRNWFKFNRNVWLDNTVEHTGKAFLGLTFNCARCHDHMYDAMTQREYFQLRAVFEPYDVRTDPLPGQPDPAQDGLVRAYDARLDTPTFLFTRGDEKQPEKERPIPVGLPQALAPSPLDVQPVALSPAAYYPGSQAFVQQQTLAAAQAELSGAEAAAVAARKSLADARTKQSEFLALAKSPPAPAPGTAPAAPTAAAPSELFQDDFSKPRPDFWKFAPGKWEYKDGRLVQLDPLDTACRAVAATPHGRDFQVTVRFRTTGGKVYKSVGVGFDTVESGDNRFVYLSAYAGGSKLQFGYRQGGQDAYPVEGARPLPAEVGRVYELQLTVRDQLLNASLDGRRQLAVRLPADRAADGRLSLWTYDATAEFLSVRVTTTPADYKFDEPTAGPPAAPAPPMTEATHQLAVAQAEAAVADAELGIEIARLQIESTAARIAADQAQFGTPPADDAKARAVAAAASERRLALRKADRALAQAKLKLETTRRTNPGDDDKAKKAIADAEAAATAAEKARAAAEQAAMQSVETYTRLGPVYGASSSGRRLALARWIGSEANPLAARVAANHLWLRHFGQPLVASVFDFGANGRAPTHPELLDMLARDLVENGWEMKRLHRSLVTGAAYRQASSGRPASADDRASSVDPENRLLWKIPVRRMEAEAVRDATLFVSGQLDRRMSGPDLPPESGLTLPRRSLYFRSSKEKKMTFLALFDSPNVVECYRRSESIAPQQALALANSSLTLAQARLLAGRISSETGDAAEAFVAEAFERILGRPATAAETAECLQFLAAQSARYQAGRDLTPFGGPSDAAVKPSADPARRARENLVHVLFNHNDFVAVR